MAVYFIKYSLLPKSSVVYCHVGGAIIPCAVDAPRAASVVLVVWADAVLVVADAVLPLASVTVTLDALVGIFETVVVEVLVPAGLTTVWVVVPNGLLGGLVMPPDCSGLGAGEMRLVSYFNLN